MTGKKRLNNVHIKQKYTQDIDSLIVPNSKFWEREGGNGKGTLVENQVELEFENNKDSMECPVCNGEKLIRCPVCHGSGMEEYDADHYASGQARVKSRECSYCYGEKKVKCPVCSGKGSISNHTYLVNVKEYYMPCYIQYIFVGNNPEHYFLSSVLNGNEVNLNANGDSRWIHAYEVIKELGDLFFNEESNLQAHDDTKNIIDGIDDPMQKKILENLADEYSTQMSLKCAWDNDVAHKLTLSLKGKDLNILVVPSSVGYTRAFLYMDDDGFNSLCPGMNLFGKFVEE